MARPPKYSPERAERVLEAIRAGATRRAAAGHAGVSEDTLERWQRRYAGFAESLTRAEAQSEVALVGLIRRAATQDWRAAAHLLERRFPDSWGRRDRVEVTVRQYAERYAAQLGLDVDELIAEAQRIVGGGAQ